MDKIQSQESNAKTYARKFPLNFIKGDGVWLFDDNGNKYLDCLACAGALPLGHNHKIVKEAILEYVDSGLPQQMLDLMTSAKLAYIQEVFEWVPQEMKNYKFQFCSPSGSDAVESAIKLCRISTKNLNIVSFTGAYHGQTMGSLMHMGNLNGKSQIGLPALSTQVFPFPNKYHHDIDPMILLESMEKTLLDEESGITKPAAIILEAVQGEGGVVVAPFEWLKGIRRICSEQKIPLIIDEVQAGWLRTGKPFAFNWSEIIPDVVVLSKSAGGSMPMALILYNPELDKWVGGTHTGTFRGNQIAMVTGKKVLSYLRENHLELHVNEVGNYFKEKLEKLKEKYIFIEEVRGLGLMLGLQIGNKCKCDGTLARKIQSRLFNEHKMIIECGGRDGSVLRFLTSLLINKDEIDIIIDKLDEVMSKLEI